MTTPLTTLLSKISDWEYLIAVEWQDLSKVRRLESEILEMATIYKDTESFAELAPWIAAFESSLKEQALFEAWREELGYSTHEKAVSLHAKRAARLASYEEAGNLDDAPNWLWPQFNSRTEPAMSVRVNGTWADENMPKVALTPLISSMFAQ